VNPLPDVPLVSIITPSYNTGAFIEETLRSVEQQDYPRVEHIVLDSGSTDGTLDILARHPSVRLVAQAPQGLSAKINHGFSLARGEIVGWLNADDLYLPDAISKAVAALQRNPDAGLVYCNFLWVDEQGVEMDRLRTRQASWRELLARLYIPQESTFVRREALAQVGPVETRYPLVQDWELWVQISKKMPIHYVDDWWSAARVRDGQRSDLYKFDFWLQARKMTREHGGSLIPLFCDYWGTKLGRAARMLRKGEYGRLSSKLQKHVASVGRHLANRHLNEY
jgi:hypothetical protein